MLCPTMDKSTPHLNPMTATLTRPVTMANATDMDVTIPAQLLWGAAQCAHTDEYKGALHCVQLELKWHDKESVFVTIRSCNGRIGYRVGTIARGDCSVTSSESEPLRIVLLAKVLTKILKTERSIIVTRIAGQTRIQGFKMGIRPDAEYVGGCAYPDLDKVWPSSVDLECKPGGFIGFAGHYLEIIGKVAQRTTEKGLLQLFTGSPAQPAVWQTDSVQGMDAPAFLLMPVQFRD